MINISLAVNDPNGNEGRWCHGLTFDCELLEMECEIYFRHHEDQVKLSRVWFSVEGYNTHVGNIMWNNISVTDQTAADICNHLRNRNVGLLAGRSDLFEKWKTNEPFVAADFDVTP